MDDQRRIITTDRAGSIWAGITWCSLLLFIVAGIIGMMAQTMLPANLGCDASTTNLASSFALPRDNDSSGHSTFLARWPDAIV